MRVLEDFGLPFGVGEGASALVFEEFAEGEEGDADGAADVDAGAEVNVVVDVIVIAIADDSEGGGEDIDFLDVEFTVGKSEVGAGLFGFTVAERGDDGTEKF